MTTSWTHIFGPLEELVPTVVEVLRELDVMAPTVHSQAALKEALALRLGEKKPGESPAATQEHAGNIVAHIHAQWTKHAGLGEGAKEARAPDPILFVPYVPHWLAAFTGEWGRCSGGGGKWDLFRRPSGPKIADLTEPTADAAKLDHHVAQLLAMPLGKPPGEPNPKKVVCAEKEVFERSPAVKAWVLREALGKCECCQSAAPFERADGTPYLELHHAVQLAAGGPDTPENAIAACPNCHRRLHHGHDRMEKLAQLYDQVGRLKKPENSHDASHG
jgi:hypothetical protein